jgi:hypothetical protein
MSHTFLSRWCLLLWFGSPPTLRTKLQNPKLSSISKKQTSTGNAYAERFGKACDRFNQKSEQHGPWGVRSAKPATVIELMGAPIEVVKISHYGRTWKNQDEVRNRVTKLLNTRTSEVYDYEPWAEFVFADVIATVQFRIIPKEPWKYPESMPAFPTILTSYCGSEFRPTNRPVRVWANPQSQLRHRRSRSSKIANRRTRIHLNVRQHISLLERTADIGI